MTTAAMTPPKVFISYSWTNEEHCSWVAELGEQLMNDGIDVLLDQWSLEDGHDVHVFMERMVNDPSIKRVIIVSDCLYAEKADGRQGGVGTETQIISAEVYNSVDQTKFVPLLRERDADGKACLPAYLKTRKYIDFSHPDSEPDAYDQLIRNIFDRPKRRKPVLGTPPTHLSSDSDIPLSSVHKSRRFREFLLNGRGNPSAAFADFADGFFVDLELLRMTFTRERADTWCDDLATNLNTAISHRDVFVETSIAGIAHMPADPFMKAFASFLERLLGFQERPESTGSSYECSEDNYKYLSYELFLYSFAACIKAQKYREARSLLDFTYVVPRTLGGTELVSRSFEAFNAYAGSMEEQCSRRGNTRRLSVMADYLHNRATRSDIRFSDLMQAEVLLLLASRGNWYPRSLIYSRSSTGLELFMRASSNEGFRPLQTIVGVTTSKELLELINSQEISRTFSTQAFWHAGITLRSLLNLDAISRLK